MKNIPSFILLTTCLLVSFRPKQFSIAPQKGVHRSIDTSSITPTVLTESDIANFRLDIELGKYCADSCGGVSFLLYATLENKSNDTLTYLDWNCEHLIWRTNNPNAFAGQPTTFCDGCLHNYPSIYSVSPHKKTFFKLRAGYTRGKQKFRLGMTLQRPIKQMGWIYYMEKDSAIRNVLQKQTTNVIWSNEISIF